MPDLSFQIEGVEPAERGLVPLLRFRLRVTNAVAEEPVQGAMLHAQIQLQPAQRRYEPEEKEKLGELFGTPDRWGQTLRNRLWTHVDTTVPAFTGSTVTDLWVPCTFDLNIAATKYFYALQEGAATLLFLFSGTVFFAGTGGRLQMQRISWEKECPYSLPVATWRGLMDRFYPNSAWLTLQRDVFERLYRYRREQGLTGWDETIERLLTGVGATS
jgi:hypothetical protein